MREGPRFSGLDGLPARKFRDKSSGFPNKTHAREFGGYKIELLFHPLVSWFAKVEILGKNIYVLKPEGNDDSLVDLIIRRFGMFLACI